MFSVAYNIILKHIPNAVSIDLGPLQRVDYPNVKFWYLNDWNDFCSKRTEPITRAMQYIQDKDGHVVDEISISAMRSLAQSIWYELGVSGAASLTWAQVDEASKKGYYRAMAAGFFNLRLCDSNWKAEQIAVDNYTFWFMRSHPDPTTGNQTKRTRNTATKAGPSKKSKVNLKSKASVSSNIQLFPKYTHKFETQSGNLNPDTGNPEKQAARMRAVSNIAG